MFFVRDINLGDKQEIIYDLLRMSSIKHYFDGFMKDIRGMEEHLINIL